MIIDVTFNETAKILSPKYKKEFEDDFKKTIEWMVLAGIAEGNPKALKNYDVFTTVLGSPIKKYGFPSYLTVEVTDSKGNKGFFVDVNGWCVDV